MSPIRAAVPVALEVLSPGNWGPLTAFLDEDEEQVTIYYRSEDTPQYQLQCICHELGHLVMGTDCALPIDESLTSQVEIKGTTIRLQARDLRDTPVEREAEEFAFSAVRFLRGSSRPVSRARKTFA